jgi:hypothetical protein
MGWGYGWGWGWNPFMWGGQNTFTTSSTEGTLFIDLIDAKKRTGLARRRYQLSKSGDKENESMNLLQRF